MRIGHHFFLQAPEVFNPLSTAEEVAWAAAAVLQQLNTAARLRYAVRLPIHSGTAILVNREASGIRMMPTAPSRKSKETAPALSGFPWGEIWTAARQRPHLARALDLFALGSAAWNLRQTFDEVIRELGQQWEAWIAEHGRAASEDCAWFRATVFGSTPQRPGLSRRSGFPWPKNRTRAMPPLAAKTFVRTILEQLILLRFKDGRS